MLPVGHLWVFWGDHIMNFEVTFLGRSLLPWQSYANKCDGNSKVMVMSTEVLCGGEPGMCSLLFLNTEPSLGHILQWVQVPSPQS